MKLSKKTIFTGFAPNLTIKDAGLASKLLFMPARWQMGEGTTRARAWLKDFFGLTNVFLCDSGRSALAIALKATGVGPGDEVIVQAFTCLVVINAIRSVGARPVYVDIGRDFNLDVADAEKKITAKTRVVILQHTFGLPAQMSNFLTLGKTKGLMIIEDCAHALGASYQGRLVGTIGDIAILSFGSDKIISCVRGGAVIVKNSSLVAPTKKLVDALTPVKRLRIWQHLMHYPIFLLGKYFYHLLLGKVILWLAQRCHLTNQIIYPEEKRGEPMRDYPAALPNALALILNQQFTDLKNIILHRQSVAHSYESKINNPVIVLPLKEKKNEDTSGAVYVRYPILVEQPQRLYEHMKKQGIILGNWYDSVVSPCLNCCGFIEYAYGSCPTAERICKQIVNLPTDMVISEKEIKRIIEGLNSYQG